MDDVTQYQQVKGMSPITAKLIECLKSGVPGDTINEAEFAIETRTELGTKGKNYSNLMAAIVYCEREYGVVWQRIRKTDIIKCLEAGERVGVGRRNLQSIRRKARRTIKVVASADMSKLNDAERSEAYAQIAQLGAIRTFSDPKNRIGNDTTPKLK
jgi:hypothetical protein